jgi:hypothetical protein
MFMPLGNKLPEPPTNRHPFAHWLNGVSVTVSKRRINAARKIAESAILGENQ